MKKTLTLITIIAFFGCNANTQKVKNTDSLAADSTELDTAQNISLIDSAKMMLDSANFYMAKGIKKELSKEKVNEKLNPIMNKFQRIYKSLSPKDTAVVYQYRIDEVNKIIDLQIEESKK